MSYILGNFMGFNLTLEYHDVWLKPVTASDGFKYHTFILVYVDDILIFYKYPMNCMSMLEENYTVKPRRISEPEVYLGAYIGKVYYPGGLYAYTMSSDSYVK